MKRSLLIAFSFVFSFYQLSAQQNVGIGTNDPKSKLDVNGGITVGNSYSGVNTAPANGAIIEGTVGIGTNSPSTKAALDVSGNTKGMFIPRLTNAESVALGATLGTGDKGLLIFNTTNNRAEYWDGTQWKAIGEGAGGPPSGTAGGDLSGSYPNPNVANNAINSAKILDGSITGNDIQNNTIDLTSKVNNVLPVSNGGTGVNTVTGIVQGNGGSPVTGISATGGSQYMRRNSSNTAYEFGQVNYSDIAGAPTALPPGGAAGGDLTGTYPNPSLAPAGTAGTYNYVTTDAKGRVTSGSLRTVTGTTNQLDVANGNFSGNPTLSINPAFTAANKANQMLTGGGNITYTSGVLSWSNRFIVIVNGSGSHFSTNGYFDITIPTNGTVITGVGGAGNVTVTGGGVPISCWTALYYILPIGSNNGSVATNFRIASYTAGMQVPENWILIGTNNCDDGTIRLGNGLVLQPGQTWPAGAGFAPVGGGSGYIQNQAVNGVIGTGQNASFDITGNSEIGGNETVGGNLGIGAPATLGKLQVTTGGTGSWDKLVVKSTSLWGDGLSSPSESGGTQYVTIGAQAAGIMISNPHVVWNAGNNAAAIRLGRAGGVSSGAYWEAGVNAGSGYHIRKEAVAATGIDILSDGRVGIGNANPGYKLTVSNGAIGGNYGLTPNYAAWNAYGTGDGGAAIYNDNGSYKKLMVIGNNSAGGAREVGIWDNLVVNGNVTATSLGTGLVKSTGGTLQTAGAGDLPTHTHTWPQVTSKPAVWLDQSTLTADNSNFNNSVPSGFYQGYNSANSPTGGTWYNMLNVRHNNTANDHGFQIAASYYDENIWTRTYQGGTGANNGSYTPWRALLHTGNIASNAIQNQYGGAQGANFWINGNGRAQDFYTDGWLRNNNVNTGIYNQSTGRHFYSESSDYWTAASGRGMIFRNSHAGTVTGYVYNDGGSSFGLLSPNGNWRVRVDNSNVETYGNYLYATSSYIPYIFDRDDPNYYLNPAGYSQVGSIYANNWFRAQGTSGLYFESYCGGWNMQDATWIRTYCGKSVLSQVNSCSPAMRGDNASSCWYGGEFNSYDYNYGPALYAGGYVNAYTYYSWSTKEKKKDISAFEANDYNSALTFMDELNLSYYKFKNQKDYDKIHVGLIAEETPTTLTAPGKQGVSYGELAIFNTGAIKALKNKVEKLEKQVNDFGVAAMTEQEQWFEFSDAYKAELNGAVPVVTTTPLSINVEMNIIEITSNGFKVRINKNKDLSFNWIAMAKVEAPKQEASSDKFETMLKSAEKDTRTVPVRSKENTIGIDIKNGTPDNFLGTVPVNPLAGKPYTDVMEDEPQKYAGKTGDSQGAPVNPK